MSLKVKQLRNIGILFIITCICSGIISLLNFSELIVRFIPFFIFAFCTVKMLESSGSFFSVPSEVMKKIKPHGKLIDIRDISSDEKYYGTCEYDVTNDLILSRTLVMEDGSEFRLVEYYYDADHHDGLNYTYTLCQKERPV